jgi:hypothetical protein
MSGTKKPQPMMTRGETAKYLRVSSHYLEKWEAEGVLVPQLRTANKPLDIVWYLRESVEAFVHGEVYKTLKTRVDGSTVDAVAPTFKRVERPKKVKQPTIKTASTASGAKKGLTRKIEPFKMEEFADLVAAKVADKIVDKVVAKVSAKTQEKVVAGLKEFFDQVDETEKPNGQTSAA